MALARIVPLIAFGVLGCATDASKTEAAREAAYEQCLRDSMAVAMAWEAIEERCRDEAGTEKEALDPEEN